MTPGTESEIVIGGHGFPAISAVPEGTQRPFWSVVVPLYNRTRYLDVCLASVLDHSPGSDEMEIIVIDDASSAPLSEMVTRLGGGRVRYHRNTRNLGLPGNWNAGLNLSRGRWIHLLHDDDCVLPGFYECLGQALRDCPPSVGAAFTGFEIIDAKGKVIWRGREDADRGIVKDWLKRVGVSNPLNMPAVVVRREAHERLGGYHPELTYTSDWELYKRIASFYDWWCEPGIFARFRVHSDRKSQQIFSSGSQARSILRAIEISEGYMPAPMGAEITAKSRRHHFARCLKTAGDLLRKGNLPAARCLVEDGLLLVKDIGADADRGR